MNEKQIGLLTALLAGHVDFAVVGGVAVNAHGYLRTTHDLDLFIRPTEDNAECAFSVLESFGVPLAGWVASDLLNDEQNLRFGTGENSVDVLSSIGEMSFDQVWRNRLESTIFGQTIPFISKADLIENKRQVGRLIDLADAEQLSLIP